MVYTYSIQNFSTFFDGNFDTWADKAGGKSCCLPISLLLHYQKGKRLIHRSFRVSRNSLTGGYGLPVDKKVKG